MIVRLGEHEDLYVCILATILEKIEGRVFVEECKATELPCDTQITILYDDKKRGWWVSLDSATASDSTGLAEPGNGVRSVSTGSSTKGSQ